MEQRLCFHPSICKIVKKIINLIKTLLFVLVSFVVLIVSQSIPTCIFFFIFSSLNFYYIRLSVVATPMCFPSRRRVTTYLVWNTFAPIWSRFFFSLFFFRILFPNDPTKTAALHCAIPDNNFPSDRGQRARGRVSCVYVWHRTRRSPKNREKT